MLYDARNRPIEPAPAQLAAGGTSRRSTASGVAMMAGQFQYEQNKALGDLGKRLDVYDRMEGDAHVKAGLRGKTLPAQTGEWKYIEASDKADAKRHRDFCNACLLRQQTDEFGPEYWVQTSWAGQRLPEILRFLNAGFSIFALSWKRAGTKIVYDQIKWLEPSTLDQINPWELNGSGDIMRINRRYLRGPGYTFVTERIEADDLALYVWEIIGERYEGRAWQRSAYGAWKRKDFMARQAALAVQKAGSGIPVAHYPQAWSGDTDVMARVVETTESMRGESPDLAYGYFPMDAQGNKIEFEYVGSDVDCSRMRQPIDGENAEIATALDRHSDILGETATGSRALGESQQNREDVSMQAIVMIVCEQEIHGVANIDGVSMKLLKNNFPNVKEPPQFVCSDVMDSVRVDPQAFTRPILEGAIVTKNDVRRSLGLEPLPDDTGEELVELKAPAPNGLPGGPDGGGQGDPMGDGEDPQDAQDSQGKAQSKGRERRQRIAAALAPIYNHETQCWEANPAAGPYLRNMERFRREDDNTARLEAADAFKARIARLLTPTREAAPNGGRFRGPNVLETEVCNLSAIDDTLKRGEAAVLRVLREMRQRMRDELLGRLRAGKVEPRTVKSQRESLWRKREEAMATLAAAIRQTGMEAAAQVEAEIAKQQVAA